MPSSNWEQMIAEAMTNPVSAVSAHTYRGKKWETFSKPIVLGCDDGKDYVVKGSQVGKAIANEQVVGRLGLQLGAPIPPIQIVDVPVALIAGNRPQIDHMRDGPAHGSVKQDNCTERAWPPRASIPENEERFGALAVLYGWMCAGDHQLIYELDAPGLVWSVDHGNFFPGGPNWTIAGLQGAGPASVDPALASLSRIQYIEEVLNRLSGVTDEQIATAVAAPPVSWAIMKEERTELAIFLARRRDALLATRT